MITSTPLRSEHSRGGRLRLVAAHARTRCDRRVQDGPVVPGSVRSWSSSLQLARWGPDHRDCGRGRCRTSAISGVSPRLRRPVVSPPGYVVAGERRLRGAKGQASARATDVDDQVLRSDGAQWRIPSRRAQGRWWCRSWLLLPVSVMADENLVTWRRSVALSPSSNSAKATSGERLRLAAMPIPTAPSATRRSADGSLLVI